MIRVVSVDSSNTRSVQNNICGKQIKRVIAERTHGCWSNTLVTQMDTAQVFCNIKPNTLLYDINVRLLIHYSFYILRDQLWILSSHSSLCHFE